jgi:DNA-binding transcriptional ArsR family regulator
VKNELIDAQDVQTLEASEAEETNKEIVLSPGKSRNGWQFFTSQGLVLISILNNPGLTVRQIGLKLNLTDRAVTQALTDLENDGYLLRERIGRRTYYHVNENHPLKYPVNPYGFIELPQLTVKSLLAENLATHAESREKFIEKLQTEKRIRQTSKDSGMWSNDQYSTKNE